ncbi:hypothetical protein ARAM_001898 [Aspergillus rambellii]|uniref:Annexin ANXC4 n=1 Tax=Aspergillus rambellii TaxID=308745 RepID=A0A0F8WL73_9EURO|nr:hypothetical protein ARAM_001898 [Aspergillus rambellii]
MSLQVSDPRSRGRSKSPGGRIRERSRSRDDRGVSPAPADPRRSSKYLVAGDPSDEKSRASSRTRGASPLRGYRTSSRYESDSDRDRRDSYARSRPSRSGDDHYYRSGSEEDRERERAAKRESSKYTAPAATTTTPSSRQPQQKSVRYDAYSDDSYTESESDDDHLVYGDAPGDLERGYYGYKGSSSHTTAPPSQPAMMTGALKPDTNPRRSAEGVSGHTGYGRPDQYQYPAIPRQSNPALSGPAPSQPTWAPVPDCEKPGFVPVSQSMPGAFPGATPSQPAASLPQYVNPSWTTAPTTNSVPAPSHQRNPSGDPKAHQSYAQPPPFQYAQVDPKVKYTSKSSTAAAAPYGSKSGAQPSDGQYGGIRYSAAPQFPTASTPQKDSTQNYVELTPGSRTAGRPHSLSVSSAHNLSVAGPDPDHRPASPMLEPYKGTYQSMSPMPSPILIAPRYDDDISDLEPLDNSTDSERRRRKSRKSRDEKERKEPKSDHSKRGSSRVRHERHDSRGGAESLVVISPRDSRRKVTFYDATPDALALKEALGHTRSIDNKTLIQLLPHLTSDEILALRKEYKNHVKIHGKGINLAKQIRVKLGNSSFGKVCYATALGRWESEAFWANCYYQSGTSRRELLIESLFGRSNGEIREIKDSFKDSRYLDSLDKCMKAELKADKFRTAVLLALEETRQSEREPIDPELVHRDVQALHAALVSRNGGETAMIYIIVRRSDAHLREVLRAYEKHYERNFARDMIQKSQNLVGETLAHILNGAINRPMRDALLLHQALRESRSGRERSELLISRLVRLHWEPRHFETVKTEYRRRYGERLEEAIAEEILPLAGGTEWGEFCIQLAQSSKTLAGKV